MLYFGQIKVSKKQYIMLSFGTNYSMQDMICDIS